MSPPVPDKRKGKPRIQKGLPARFGTEAKMCGGTVVDISEGGMRIQSESSFPVNSIIIVFVQFPRHSVRLRARVIWGGAGGAGGAAAMGLALTQPEPTLKQAYAEWLAEVKKAASEEQASVAPAPAAPRVEDPAPTPAPTAACTAPPTPPAPEPRSPVRRKLESRQGESYDALLERQPDGWRLTIVQI